MKIKKRTKQKVSSKKVLLVCVRYILLLGIVFSLPFIYAILTQPTITPVVSLLKLMYSDVEVLENTISIDKTTFIEIIPACIAGSAYLLLIILNLSIPLSTKKRIYALVFSLAVLFVVNVIRISMLSIWYHEKFSFFNSAHIFLWYILSTVFVVVIWIATIKIFSI